MTALLKAQQAIARMKRLREILFSSSDSTFGILAGAMVAYVILVLTGVRQ